MQNSERAAILLRATCELFCIHLFKLPCGAARAVPGQARAAPHFVTPVLQLGMSVVAREGQEGWPAMVAAPRRRRSTPCRIRGFIEIVSRGDGGVSCKEI